MSRQRGRTENASPAALLFLPMLQDPNLIMRNCILGRASPQPSCLRKAGKSKDRRRQNKPDRMSVETVTWNQANSTVLSKQAILNREFG